jgi:site-specific recombinase XerD
MIATNKGKKFPAEPLTQDEVKRLIRNCSQASTGIRNRALIAVLYRGGLRLGEALALLPKDLDRENCALRVLHGKGDRSRLIGMDNGAWAILERWLDRRHSLGIANRSPLLCTLKGEAITPSYVRALLPRLAKRAGIEKRVHPHALRHTHAFELANEATPLHLISCQLGHANVQTTDRYIRHLNPTAVVSAMRSREWSL